MVRTLLAAALARAAGSKTALAKAAGSKAALAKAAVSSAAVSNAAVAKAKAYRAAAGPHLAGVNVAAITIGGIVVLLAVVIFITGRVRRRRGLRGGVRPDSGFHAEPSTDELRATAGLALVAADDAVRTSAQELGFVTARSGDRAAAPFLTALQSAHAELGAAFARQQSLDDRTPHWTRARAHLTEIAARCAAASRLLDEQAADFDRLQDTEARAPQLLAEVEAH